MSRIGKQPVILPDKVKASFQNGLLTIEGPKGKLFQKVPEALDLGLQPRQIDIKIKPKAQASDPSHTKMLHGLMRSLSANMVKGVVEGFQKVLMIEGTGYRAAVQDGKLTLQIGFTHPVVFIIPQGIEITVDKQVRLTIKGSDKQLVGELAAKIRAVRPPEPYKGKGIRYLNEVIKKKAGKAAIKQTA